MKNHTEEFIESMKEGHAYDFISNNYWKMEKSELADILKEYIWAFETNKNEEELKECLNDLVEEEE